LLLSGFSDHGVPLVAVIYRSPWALTAPTYQF